MKRRLRATVVANKRSGSVDDENLAHLRASLDHFDGPKIISFHAAPPEHLFEVTQRAVKEEPDMIFVVGGDGAARTAAEAAAESNTPIAPLPYGTMNLLPRRLYGERSGPEIVKALARGRVGWLPCGRVNERLFLLSAAAGFPVSAAQTREDLRSHTVTHLADAVTDAVRTLAEAGERRIVFRGDDRRPRRVSAMLLATAPVDGLVGATVSWTDAKAFDVVAATTHGAIDLARLGAHALLDDWRQDEAVELSSSVDVEAWVGGEAIVALDGDPAPMKNPLRFTFEPRGAPVMLAPPEA